MLAPSFLLVDLKWKKIDEAVLGPADGDALIMDSNRRLFRRWMAAGHGEWMVPRDAFDVVELGGLVGSLCVYDRDETHDDYLCRVYGGTVVEDMGIDMTGRAVSDYPDPLRQVLRRQYDRALASRRPVVVVHELIRMEQTDLYPREQGRVFHEKLILPITRSGRTIDCFITHVARVPGEALAGWLRTRGNGPIGAAE